MRFQAINNAQRNENAETGNLIMKFNTFLREGNIKISPAQSKRSLKLI